MKSMAQALASVTVNHAVVNPVKETSMKTNDTITLSKADLAKMLKAAAMKGAGVRVAKGQAKKPRVKVTPSTTLLHSICTFMDDKGSAAEMFLRNDLAPKSAKRAGKASKATGSFFTTLGKSLTAWANANK